MYPHPGDSLRAWQVYGGLLILLAVTMLVVERKSRRYLLVGWLWFLGTMVPMIGLVQVGRQAMADRYAYLPLLGIFIMMCWGVSDYAQQKHLPTRFVARRSAVLVIIGAWGSWPIGRSATGPTTSPCGRTPSQVTAPNYIAQDDLGGALMSGGGWKRPSGTSARRLRSIPSIPSATSISASTISSMAIWQKRSSSTRRRSS